MTAVENQASEKADAASISRPLVSVGIPTYNRPVGLRRTLRLICGQTYQNIEIIVSDNASPDPETRSVVEEFVARDERIKYFRQPSNIGALANFRFVLAKASGEYFMWAADDDEWDAKFIETCVAVANPSCSVMTSFSTVNRVRQTRQENSVPSLSPDAKTCKNVESYLSNMQPSFYYGLHPRKSIQFALDGPHFDFYDCYFVLRIILEGNFRTIEQNLYSAGVDSLTYEIKYADQAPGRKSLDFWSFFSHSFVALLLCARLSNLEKTWLILKLARLVFALRRHHSN